MNATNVECPNCGEPYAVNFGDSATMHIICDYCQHSWREAAPKLQAPPAAPTSPSDEVSSLEAQLVEAREALAVAFEYVGGMNPYSRSGGHLNVNVRRVIAPLLRATTPPGEPL